MASLASDAAYLFTGQATCHDALGLVITCEGTGQDAEFRTGSPWPEPRFELQGDLVVDQLTGLYWSRHANLPGFPLTWNEALDYVMAMNQRSAMGRNDWRVPNRRELRSLISHQTRRPALPQPSPFTDVFPGWYWTSTTAASAPAHAWYVNMDGGRMFFGGKDQSFLLWPVAGEGSGILPVTGQTVCFDADGSPIACAGSGQDGEMRLGRAWPDPRFLAEAGEVRDLLTGLRWRRVADLCGTGVDWHTALLSVAALNAEEQGGKPWRLPTINELESLVDCSTHHPALPAAHSFYDVRDVYWSSTTSLFESDWAWALYLDSGGVGVGQKSEGRFSVWAVRDDTIAPGDRR